MRQFVFADPRTGVGDLYNNGGSVFERAHFDFRAARGELERVINQVVKSQKEQIPVADHEREGPRRMRHGEVQFATGGVGSFADEQNKFGEQLTGINLFLF